MSDPVTLSRNFDLTVYTLRRNQQMLALALLIPWFTVMVVGNKLVGPHITNRIALVMAVIEICIFLYIGRNPIRLYRFECLFRFLWSLQRNTDYIWKYAEDGLKQAQEFSHIKKVHKGGYIEYTFEKSRPNNWGYIIRLDAFSPDSFQKFVDGVELFIVGLLDGTVLKTTINVRKDLKDYAEPIKIDLNKESVPELVRQSMFEHQQFIESAEIKSYENYMLILLPYTASPKKAKAKLKTTVNSICEVLDGMKIGYKKLDTADKIKEAFFGCITGNFHLARRKEDESI